MRSHLQSKANTRTPRGRAKSLPSVLESPAALSTKVSNTPISTSNTVTEVRAVDIDTCPSDSVDTNSLTSNLLGFEETSFRSLPSIRPSLLDMAAANNNSEPPNPDHITPLGTNNVLLESIQTMLRDTQIEIRSEMTALRDQVRTVQERQSQNDTTTTNSSMLSNASEQRNTNNNIDLEKWKISFDGTTSVSDFLFKLETLFMRTLCAENHLLSNFQIFLSGKAEKWYWQYVKQERHITFASLKHAITKEFGNLEKDLEIMLKISARKQSAKESFDDFYSSIISMNLLMRQPLMICP